jgi:hypothetical protein
LMEDPSADAAAGMPHLRDTSDRDAAWAIEVLRRHAVPVDDLFTAIGRRKVDAYVTRLREVERNSVAAAEVEQARQFLRRHDKTRSKVAAKRALDGRPSYGERVDHVGEQKAMTLDEANLILRECNMSIARVMQDPAAAYNLVHFIRTRRGPKDAERLERAVQFVRETCPSDKAVREVTYEPDSRRPPMAEATLGVRMDRRTARQTLQRSQIPVEDVYDPSAALALRSHIDALKANVQLANEGVLLETAIAFLQREAAAQHGGNSRSNAFRASTVATDHLGGRDGASEAVRDERAEVVSWATRLLKRHFRVDNLDVVLHMPVGDLDEEIEHLDAAENERIRCAVELLQLDGKGIDFNEPLMSQYRAIVGQT